MPAGRNDTEFLQLILNSISEGFVVQNQDGVVTHFNDSACRILKLEPEELLGKSSSDPAWRTIKKDGSPFLADEHPAMVTLRTGKPQVGVVMGVVTRDEKTTWIQINSVPFLNQSALTTFSDVTDQILERIQLEEAQKVAKIGSWSFDLETQKIHWTPQMYEIFPEQRKNGPPSYERHVSTIHAEDQSLWLKTVQNCVQNGKPYLMRFRTVHPDRVIWVEARGRGVYRADGSVKALEGTCQDITEQVQSAREAKFIADALKVGIFTWDIPSNCLEWDQNNFDLYEVSPDQFSSTFEAWERSLTPSSREVALRELQLAIENHTVFDTQFQIKTPLGRTKFIRAKGEFIRGADGRPLRMFGFNWDNTKEALLEQSLKAQQSKMIHTAKLASMGEMSAGVAHEINNPLAIIMGNLSMLEREMSIDEKLKARLIAMNKGIERITKIVTGLRKYSRSTETKCFVRSALTPIIEEALTLPLTKARPLGVTIQTQLNALKSIHCDEIEMEQVVVNLVTNAIDAALASVEKKVRIETFDEGAQVVLRVLDSGLGVPETIRDRIFDPFFTTKEVGQGTGLGLSIVRGILEDHGATILLKTDESQTCFEVRFQGS